MGFKDKKKLVILFILAILLPLSIFLVQQVVKLGSKASLVDAADTTFEMPVLVIKYFPLTADRQNIDIRVTGDVGEPYAVIKQRTVDIRVTREQV